MLSDITLLSKYRRPLMGIAILWITLYHCLADPVQALGVPVLREVLNSGWLGVEIFLFLSGIGLYFSMSKNSAAKPFYLRRVQKVIIPWLILSLPYWIIKTLVFDRMRVRALLLNWCGASFWLFGVKSVWYIAFLVVLYALYPLIFRLQKKNAGIIIVLIAAAFVLNVVMLLTVPAYYAKTELAFARIPVFLLGSLTGGLLKSGRKSRGINFGFACYTAGTLALFVTGLLLAGRGADRTEGSAVNMLIRIGGQGAALPVMCGFCLLFEKRKLPRFQRAADFLGGFTLELYLLHVFLGHIAERIGFDDTKSLPVQFLVQLAVIALSAAGAWGFSRRYGKISAGHAQA
ncbi:MAG: acyltransferase [Oscillospiraceae bacterium]|nr:acyltransferase [Oscillospiraceae bacterium]